MEWQDLEPRIRALAPVGEGGVCYPALVGLMFGMVQMMWDRDQITAEGKAWCIDMVERLRRDNLVEDVRRKMPL